MVVNPANAVPIKDVPHGEESSEGYGCRIRISERTDTVSYFQRLKVYCQKHRDNEPSRCPTGVKGRASGSGPGGI